MADPQVPIDVEESTGIWRTDGLPMVYLPRHFLVNNHLAVEAALGRDAYREILRAATDKSALHWCRSEAKTHGLTPEATVRHYFKRLSQRGWGQFTVEALDPAGGRGQLTLRHSLFALERPQAGEPVCYMFEGFLTGAFRFLLGEAAALMAREVHCLAQGRHDHCRFEVEAAAS